MFETNKCVYRSRYQRGWIFTVKMIVDKGGPKFL